MKAPVHAAVHCKSFDLWRERGPLMRMLTIWLAGDFLGGLWLIRTHWLRQHSFWSPQRAACNADWRRARALPLLWQSFNSVRAFHLCHFRDALKPDAGGGGRGRAHLQENSFFGCVFVCEPLFHTEAGDVSVQSDIFEVPLGCLHLRRVALRHVVHGEHRLLTELGVVIKVDLGIKANHWGKETEERRETKKTKGLGLKAAGKEAREQQALNRN